MDNSSLHAYMKSLPTRESLEKPEEIKLAETVRGGGEEGEVAKKKLMESHLRLVVKIARSHENMGVEVEDLVSEGNLGLLKAIERFNPLVGCRLSTYATWWIRQSIRAALARHGRTIRVPRKALEKLARVKKIVNTLAQELGREPTLEELEEETEIPKHKLQKILGWNVQTISTETKRSEDGDSIGASLMDNGCLSPATSASQESDWAVLNSVLATLPEHYVAILHDRFGWKGEKKTLEEIGDRLAISRERVRQIEEKCLKKLRRRLKAVDLRRN